MWEIAIADHVGVVGRVPCCGLLRILAEAVSMCKNVLLPLVFLFAAATARANAAAGHACHIPVSIGTSSQIRQQIERMIARSATFRQQCQRLDIPRLSVQIRTDLQLGEQPTYHARTTIARSATGVVAWVSLAAFDDPAEWLGHEFEHIIEQLEGVDVPQLATTSRHDAWCTGDSMFETARDPDRPPRTAGSARPHGRRHMRACSPPLPPSGSGSRLAR
jgi:hypothetical protein